MPLITKEHALRICRKLEAKDITPHNSAHEKFGVFYDGKMVGFVGIRRSPRRDQPHGHVPADLNLPPRFAWEIASCTKYLSDYLSYLKEKGLLPGASESQSQESDLRSLKPPPVNPK